MRKWRFSHPRLTVRQGYRVVGTPFDQHHRSTSFLVRGLGWTATEQPGCGVMRRQTVLARNSSFSGEAVRPRQMQK
ncbi:hypothetical protein FRIGORI9N_350023 [Frigoribacterium sp. 9N]|nr:hypothetical protein FRIGORI9N_350023 [Frigoribacterium sp. 9N]